LKSASKQRSKRHHYIPQAILKEFCVSGNSTCYVSRNAASRNPQMRNIGTIFCRRHYNSYVKKNGEKNDAVERFFAYELDNYVPEWSALFKSALKRGDLKFSNEASRFRFIQFFYNHMKRGPDFIEPIVQKASEDVFHANIETELEAKGFRLSDADKLLLEDEDFRSTVMNNSRVRNFSRQSEDILNQLASMQIHVATPQRSVKEFIVSSQPVARFEDYPYQQLGEPGVELWTTFSPKLAIGFAKYEGASDCLLFDDVLVRKLNRQLAKQSTSIAGRSERLLRSLLRSAW